MTSSLFFVIPAKAGIQSVHQGFGVRSKTWTPAYAGVTA